MFQEVALKNGAADSTYKGCRWTFYVICGFPIERECNVTAQPRRSLASAGAHGWAALSLLRITSHVAWDQRLSPLFQCLESRLSAAGQRWECRFQTVVHAANPNRIALVGEYQLAALTLSLTAMPEDVVHTQENRLDC
jgi:hypothetical protein